MESLYREYRRTVRCLFSSSRVDPPLTSRLIRWSYPDSLVNQVSTVLPPIPVLIWHITLTLLMRPWRYTSARRLPPFLVKSRRLKLLHCIPHITFSTSHRTVLHTSVRPHFFSASSFPEGLPVSSYVNASLSKFSFTQNGCSTVPPHHPPLSEMIP